MTLDEAMDQINKNVEQAVANDLYLSGRIDRLKARLKAIEEHALWGNSKGGQSERCQGK